jgi:hypothetical protein
MQKLTAYDYELHYKPSVVANTKHSLVTQAQARQIIDMLFLLKGCSDA